MNDQATRHPVVRLAEQFGLTTNEADQTNLVQTLAKTIMPKGRNAPTPTKEEITAFCLVALEYKLNPWTKEIYAFPQKGGGVVPIVGVDGWLSIANRHPQMDGMEFEWGPEIKVASRYKDYGTSHDVEVSAPEWVDVIIHRKDRAYPIRIREWLVECIRETKNWCQMPRRMLRNRGMCQGERIAFSISGIYLPDEAEDFAARDAEFTETPTTMAELAPAPVVEAEPEIAQDPEPEPDEEPTPDEPNEFSGMYDENATTADTEA